MAKQTFTAGQTLTAAQMNDLQTNDFNMSVSTQTANYTLVVGDRGTREVMNMSSAGTVTVPNNVFTAGDALWLHSIGSGTISVVAGAGLTLNSSAGTAPTLAQWEGGVVYFTSASSAIFFRGGGVGAANFSDAATGTYSSGGQSYKYITFNASSTLNVTKAGFANILVIGGGGGGGRTGGGGGAGGYNEGTDVYLPAGALTVTIGAGGNGSNVDSSKGQNGNMSMLHPVYVAPGGGGGGCIFAIGQGGGSGGGGGSGDSPTFSYVGGTGVGPIGNSGGTGNPSAGRAGGGGGGASAAGSNATAGGGGAGGAGTASSITGSSVTRAGGGGGAGDTTDGAGGAGGGSGGDSGTDGTANTGGGGGGTTGATGRNGGSGIVIVAVKT